jgi:hypothetical protein
MKHFLVAVIGALILFSCGNSKDSRTPGEYLSAFVQSNSSVVSFGKIDLNQLLEKAEYKKLPKVGVILNGYLNELSGAINLETPIHFAVEGPFLADGTPETIYAFIETVNPDTLAAKVTQQGYDMEEDHGMHYFADGDVAFGTKNNLTVIISKKGEFDAKALLNKVFEDSQKDLAGGKIEEILDEEADLVAGVSMQNMYVTSNTDLNDLSAQKRKEVDEMVKDSYVLTTLNFEEGQVVMNTRNLFSDALMEKMFLRSDEGAGIVKRLGSGKPTLGFAMNMDMRKLQDFMETYSPNTLKELGESAGGPAAMMMAMGGKDLLSNMLTGELGAVLVGSPNMQEGISDFNFFVGLGKQGKMMAEQGEMFLDAMGMQEVKLDKEGLWVSSNKDYAASSGGSLKLPEGCEDFGKKGMHFFLNLDGVDLTTFEFENEQKIIYLIKYINFEMDNEGSSLLIKAKKNDGNILKQAVDLMFKELEGKIGGFAS